MSKELPEDHSVSAHKDIVGQVMHRWKHHDPKPLHSGRGKGGKEGKVVTDPKQAIAISLSIAEKAKERKGPKKGKEKTVNHSERLQALGFSEEVSGKVAEMLDETFDFTRCVRPDGTAYGTGGKCRKGMEARGPSLNEQIRDAYEREQAARRAGDSEGARKAMREHMTLTKKAEEHEKQAKQEKQAKSLMERIQREADPVKQRELLRKLEDVNNPLVKLPGGRVARTIDIRSPYET